MIKNIYFDESNNVVIVCFYVIIMTASFARGTAHIWTIARNYKNNEENEKAKGKGNKIELNQKQENEEI